MRPTFKIPTGRIVIFAFVSAFILFILFKTWVNLEGFYQVAREIDKFYFYWAFALMAPITFLGVTRWYLVLKAAGFKIAFWKIFKVVISGISLSLVPGRLGDLARSYPLRNSIPVAQSIGTIILEKIIDVSILMVFSGIGLSILGNYGVSVLILSLAIGTIPVLQVLNFISEKMSLKNPLINKAHEAISILNRVKQRKTVLFAAVLTSCANWTVSMFQVYWLFKTVGSVVPFSAVFAFHPLSTFAGLIPISIAGIGTRDSAIIYFFRNFVAPEQSLAVGILYGVQAYWIFGILGIPLLYYFFRQNKY